MMGEDWKEFEFHKHGEMYLMLGLRNMRTWSEEI